MDGLAPDCFLGGVRVYLESDVGNFLCPNRMKEMLSSRELHFISKQDSISYFTDLSVRGRGYYS